MQASETSTPLLLVSLSLPLIVSAILLALFVAGKRVGRKACAAISFATLMLSTILLVIVSLQVLELNRPVHEVYEVAALTVFGGFGLFADWLSLPLAVAIAFLSALSALYSMSYMESLETVHIEPEMIEISVAYEKGLKNPEFVPDRGHGVVPSMEAYFGNLLLFAGSMLGIVLSMNLASLFIFFELAIVPTFLLVYVWGSGPCRLIAIKYFVYMFLAGAFLLLGISWIYALVKSLDLLILPNLLARIGSQEALAIAILLFIGFGMKAAIIPFHTWLPDFHAEAPVPIHALLSAVLIKCGIYGIVRIVYPSFPSVVGGLGNEWGRSFLMMLSLGTMVWGAVMALKQIQIKRILAYSSVNQIGYIMLGLSSGTVLGISGGLLHVITHGIAKGMLLLCAGSIIHQSHVRDVDKLGGLLNQMPVTAMATLLGGLSIAGVPPLAGFVSELMIFAGVVEAGYWAVAFIGLLVAILTTAYYLWAFQRIFLGSPRDSHSNIHESPSAMLIPMCIESFLILLLGIWPLMALPFISPAAKLLNQILAGG